MAKGDNAKSKGRNREYWSRRPYAGFTPSKSVKIMTHRQERRVLAKKALREELEK